MNHPDLETIIDFMESLPAVLYEYVIYPDRSREVLYVSPQSYDILGYADEYFQEDVNNFFNLITPDDLEPFNVADVSANQQNEFFVFTVNRITSYNVCYTKLLRRSHSAGGIPQAGPQDPQSGIALGQYRCPDHRYRHG